MVVALVAPAFALVIAEGGLDLSAGAVGAFAAVVMAEVLSGNSGSSSSGSYSTSPGPSGVATALAAGATLTAATVAPWP